MLSFNLYSLVSQNLTPAGRQSPLWNRLLPTKWGVYSWPTYVTLDGENVTMSLANENAVVCRQGALCRRVDARVTLLSFDCFSVTHVLANGKRLPASSGPHSGIIMLNVSLSSGFPCYLFMAFCLTKMSNKCIMHRW